ncbi:hypothetical protein BVY04_04010 [bacterium M21]|nr:hypothetical protein BVY04_04010 [bacterium M21]
MFDRTFVVQNLGQVYFVFFWSCITALALVCFPFPLGLMLAVIPIFAGAAVVFGPVRRLRDRMLKSLINDQFGAFMAVSQHDQSKLPLPLRWVIAVGSVFGLVMTTNLLATGQFWDGLNSLAWNSDFAQQYPQLLSIFISSGITLLSFLFFLSLTLLMPKLLHRTRWSWAVAVGLLLVAFLAFLTVAISSQYQEILLLYPARTAVGAQARVWAATGCCLIALMVLFYYRHLYFLCDSDDHEPVPDLFGWVMNNKLRKSMVNSLFLLVVIYFLGTYSMVNNMVP